ncbi:primosomal protein N' [Pseudanabaena sp. PCC 6802]|uniref:primosomal protein N' n=1 Tax=Pseudanabaena sp. PCC 6802 TaxID=118173 RepID=UPI000346D4C1|nr:primosomal protein N' [Pseudanabaena sp. PCC 6802]
MVNAAISVSVAQTNYQASAATRTQALVQVLVDCQGIEGLLTYSIPADMKIAVGDILTVPLGARYVGAIALHLVNASEQPEFDGEIKPVSSLVSTGIFPPYYWQLLARTAEYYRTPLIQTVKAALPPKLMDRGSYRIRINAQIEAIDEANLSPAARAVWQFLSDRASQSHHKSDRKGVTQKYLYQHLSHYTHPGLKELHQLGYISTYLEPPQRPQPKYEDCVILLRSPDEYLTTRQKEVITVLQRLGGDVLRSQLIEQAKTTYASLQNLAKKGYIAIEARECLRLGDKTHVVAKDRPKQLTPAQAEALARIQALTSTSTLLLHGVTGSGKTEVYLQAIAPVLQQGKSALVLVPEIGLTPQLMDRFRARFGDRYVNAYHSQLSDGERFDTWRQMLSGEPQIAIGTRSAVFAPLHNLGLIVLDEEHDSSFKQDRPQPCYHARTVAQWRSELEDCPLILGSATPSTEMLYLVKAQGSQTSIGDLDSQNPQDLPEISERQSIQYLTLPDRIGNKPMPPIAVVDMREELKSGNWSMFSRQLQAAIARMQAQGKQGILFIHRRGHSTFVSCRSCGHVMMCPHCDVSLSYHVSPTRKDGDLRCHYCNYVQTKPRSCPACGSPYFKHFGSGTQKVEQELTQLFPSLRLIRFDSDTTRNKDGHRSLLSQFQAGEADLLIGTQMIAKGIDIPQVTLVGVISADGLLNFSDYRAGERAFQTLTQVAGRAGRGDDPGEVIIQTYTPEHPVIQAVQTYDFNNFMQSELGHRAALSYPPIGQMALIHLSSADAIAVETASDRLAEYLQAQSNDWEVLGPAPAAVTRVKNRYRWQILLKFNSSALPHLPNLETLRSALGSRSVRLAIDIDPLTIL